jgi:hypothetical protein
MKQSCFQQTHVIGYDHSGLTVEFVYIIKTAQVQFAAHAFQQLDIAVAEFSLIEAIEFSGLGAFAGIHKNTEIFPVKIPAAAQKQIIHERMRYIIRCIISVTGKQIVAVSHKKILDFIVDWYKIQLKSGFCKKK